MMQKELQLLNNNSASPWPWLSFIIIKQSIKVFREWKDKRVTLRDDNNNSEATKRLSCYKINFIFIQWYVYIVLYIQNDSSSNILKVLQWEFHIIQLFYIPPLNLMWNKGSSYIYIYIFNVLCHTRIPIHLLMLPQGKICSMTFLQGEVCSKTNFKGISCCAVVALMVLACGSRSANDYWEYSHVFYCSEDYRCIMI